MIPHVPAWLLWALAFVVGLPVIGFAIIMVDFWIVIRRNLRKEQSK